MIPVRSFQSRLLAVLLLMALVPTALSVVGGTLLLREVGTTVGTLGPWDAVAGSGQELADEATRAAPDDSAVARAAEAHRDALSSSLQRSRLWSLVSDRVVALLPVAALLMALMLAALALLAARWLSAGISRPIHELVGWAERIGRGEALPPPETEDGRVEEFGVLRASLREMAEGLAEARRKELESARLRAWTEMARRVAHELKNPLTPMRMAASTLERSDDEGTTATAEILLEEIGRLDEMARTFSQFGRMPEGPPSEVDLEELARTLAGRHGGEGRSVRVIAEDDLPMIHGHYELLSRALRNLLVNALEATEDPAGERAPPEPETPAGDGPEPRVEVVLRGTGGGVRILVRDRGPGVPTELHSSIWLPDVTTKQTGTGLGLTMVRQAAEAHGGSVDVRDREGGGAEFELLVPTNGVGTGSGGDADVRLGDDIPEADGTR